MNELTFDLQDSKIIELSKELILSKVKEEAIWSFYGVPITKGLFCSKLRNDRNPTCSLYKNKTVCLLGSDKVAFDEVKYLSNIVSKVYFITNKEVNYDISSYSNIELINNLLMNFYENTT